MKYFIVKDYDVLYKIAMLVDKGLFKNISYTGEAFFKYLIDRFDKDAIRVFVAIDKNKIKGFIISSITTCLVKDNAQIFIDLAYIEKGQKAEVGEKLLENVEQHAKELSIDEICAYSLRGERSMFSKYGFEKDYTSYVRKVGGNNGTEKNKSGTGNTSKKHQTDGGK